MSLNLNVCLCPQFTKDRSKLKRAQRRLPMSCFPPDLFGSPISTSEYGIAKTGVSSKEVIYGLFTVGPLRLPNSHIRVWGSHVKDGVREHHINCESKH